MESKSKGSSSGDRGGSGDGEEADRGRFSARRKMETVLRLLRGEDLDSISRELGVRRAVLSAWRDAFLAGGKVSLKSRPADSRDEEIARLKSLVGDLTMRLEFHREEARRRREGLPLDGRRPRA